RSGLTKPWVLPDGFNWRSARSVAYAPAAQLDENAAWPLLIARSDPIADASLPDMRARRRPGTAIAAMMPMIATTISSSMRVKRPSDLRNVISVSSKKLFDPACKARARPSAGGCSAAHGCHALLRIDSPHDTETPSKTDNPCQCLDEWTS